MTKRNRRSFTSEFKQQMVQLYLNGEPRNEIIHEYNLVPSSLDRWVKQSRETGSFKERDNRSPEENERYFKASSADNRTKVNVIRQNNHKYSVSAMCKVLQLPKSTYYYECKHTEQEESR